MDNYVQNAYVVKKNLDSIVHGMDIEAFTLYIADASGDSHAADPTQENWHDKQRSLCRSRD